MNLKPYNVHFSVQNDKKLAAIYYKPEYTTYLVILSIYRLSDVK